MKQNSNKGPDRYAFLKREEVELAREPQALVDYLDLLLTQGTTSDAIKEDIVERIRMIPLTKEEEENYDGPVVRTQVVLLAIMTNQDNMVQQ